MAVADIQYHAHYGLERAVGMTELAFTQLWQRGIRSACKTIFW